MTTQPQLVVYSRRGCHLCEDLLAELEALVRRRVRIDVVDVDSEPALRERYGLRIPVVCADTVEICHYRLDQAAVRDWLSRVTAREPAVR